MIIKKEIKLFLILLLSIFTFYSCVTTSYNRETYRVGDKTIIDGIKVELKSAEFKKSFSNWVGQYTYSADKFLIIDVECTNIARKPLPYYFQPVYKLIDENDYRYESSDQNTLMINMNKSGRSAITESWNPNVKRRKEIVFEVPEKNYKLMVIAPTTASYGFSGNVNVRGDYILFDLSTDNQGSGIVPLSK